MNIPTEAEVERAKEDTAFISDIIMRMLAGRDLVICFNVCATVLHSIANELPKEPRQFIVDCLKKLTVDIEELKEERQH